MTRQAKTPKFLAYEQFPFCFDFQTGHMDFRRYFQTDGPYTVEMGCAKADLLIGLAEIYPWNAFIGIDIKSDRMWHGARRVSDEGRTNIAFIRSHARYITDIFAPKSVQDIWLTFPDPFPRQRSSKHRLTHSNYLDLYAIILIKGGRIKLKTDDRALFEWSLRQMLDHGRFVLQDRCDDLHAQTDSTEARITTAYERRYMDKGSPIRYAEFCLR